jgi:hypothetical protein
MHSAGVILSETQNAREHVTGAVIPIFIFPGEQPNSVVEIGPTHDGHIPRSAWCLNFGVARVGAQDRQCAARIR